MAYQSRSTWGKRSNYTARPRVNLAGVQAPATPPTFTPSKYQQAILDWLLHGEGSAIVDATAGSGKTSTLKLLAFNLPTNARAVFLAFNKSIATELATKLPSTVTSSTFHALGFKALRSVVTLRKTDSVSAYKVGNLYDDMYPSANSDHNKLARPVVLRLIALAKGQVLLPADITSEWCEDTAFYYDVDLPDALDLVTLTSMVRDTLTASNKETTYVDFDDMLYLPLILGAAFEPYQYVMIDEAQDTNAAQRQILARLLRGGGRLIAVGDAAQAIYGFRGADSDALDLIASEFNCVRFPLSISYRCPRAIVQLASEFSDNIEAAPNAIEGTVLYPSKWSVQAFKSGDLLMCRNTAPIIRVAYKCLVARVPVQVMGREIGNGLKALIKKLAGRKHTLDTLPQAISEYQEREVAACLAKRQEYKAQAVADKCEAILILMDSMTPEDRTRGIDGLLAIIDMLFSDQQNAVRMSTVHKAKGLEAHHTYILDAHLMPSKYAKLPHQQQQERNIQFVATTRSLDTLTYLTSDMLNTAD